jgi:hypothetical protein
MSSTKLYVDLVITMALTIPWLSIAQSACPVPHGTGEPWRVDQAIAFESRGLAVDADGAPNSYLVDGKGLSDTCDGVVALVDGKRVTRKTDAAHWYSICQHAWVNAQATGDYSGVVIFGFLISQDGPAVQKAGDPFPNRAFISTNTLTIPHTPDRTQRHWADATKIPYVVLPVSFMKNYHVATGDLAIVYRSKTSSIAYGVVGDTGDLGEGSIKLHRALGNDPISVRHGVARANRGIAEPIMTLVFPGVNPARSSNSDSWNVAIEAKGIESLQEWGGIERLKACLEKAQDHPH